MILKFTPQAADELEAIIDHIKDRSPSGARQVRERIEILTENLRSHPRSGLLTTSGIRRLHASPYPYLVFYEIWDEDIVVIGVRHAARDPMSMPGA